MGRLTSAVQGCYTGLRAAAQGCGLLLQHPKEAWAGVHRAACKAVGMCASEAGRGLRIAVRGR